jgi:DnaD/phage-associated family protein
MSPQRFPGFPDRMTYLPLPASFFGSLLRDIDSLGELKLTLHCWRLLHQQKGSPRFLRRSQLENDRWLLLALASPSSGTPLEALASALQAACARGTLLCLPMRSENSEEACYFLNTAANEQIIRKIEAGELSLGPLRPVRPPGPPPAIPRPGVYELYEQNIGLLTPLIAEELREAELQFPADWIEDAFREAVAYNRRNWRYVRRVLEAWASQGRGERGENRGHVEPPEDPGKYLQGRYGRLIKR